MAKDKEVQAKTTTKTQKPRPKKANKASLKRLSRIALEAIAMAHKQFPYVKGLEEAADAAAKELRGMTTPNDKFTVFGNSPKGMSGRLDEALMLHDPSDWSKLLVAIAKEDNRYRRKSPADHASLITHMKAHLSRMAGMTTAREADNVRALKKVGLSDKVEEIMNLMAPIATLWGVYAKAISYK